MLSRDGINIRHVQENDLEVLWTKLNDLDSRGKYLPCAMNSPVKMIKAFQENGLAGEEFERLLIFDDQNLLLGTIWHFKSVPYFDAREIGYILFAENMRGKNIATGAVSLLVDYLFKSKNINRLEIRMDTRNVASERVAQKNGFTKEGVSRGANFVNGVHVDMCVYALLRNEWK